MLIPLRVLMVEDSENDASLILRQLRKAGYAVESQRVETAGEMQAALEERAWDIVTLDYSLPAFDAPSALTLLHQRGLDLPAIVISGEITEELAVILMRSGAQDYLRKDNLARLAPVLERELLQARKRQEQHQAEEAVRASEERYRSLIEQASEGIFIADPQGNYVEVNPSGCELLGYTREEILKLNMNDLLPAEDQRVMPVRMPELRSGNVVISQRRLLRKDGSLVEVEISAKKLSDGRLQGIVRDVTERKRAEDELRRMNRVYALTSQVNQMMVHTRDAMEFFTNLCRIAIDDGHFRMAWLGLVDEFTQVIRPVSWYGEERGYLQMIKEISISDVPEGRGPVGSSARSGQICFCNDIANDPAMLPWRDEALARGYCSLIALPLALKGKVIAVFSLYASEAFFFNQAEIRLLQEVTADVIYALEMLESGKQRILVEERLQEALQRLNFHVENSPLAVVQFDSEFRISMWSGRAQEMFGWSEPEVIGQRIQHLRWFADADFDPYKTLVAGQARSTTITRNHRKDGTQITCQWHNSAMLESNGALISLRSQVLDISAQEQSAQALRESEAKFRLLVEQSPNGILMLDQHGMVIEWNLSQEKIYGFTKAEALGQPGWEIQYRLTPAVRRSVEQREKNKKIILESLKTGTLSRLVRTIEFEIQRADGSLGWVESIAFIVKTAEGNNSVTISNDITQRKQAEAELSANAAQLDLVFSSTLDMQILFRVEGEDSYVIQMINRAFIDSLEVDYPGLAEHLVGMERKEYLRALGTAQSDIESGLARYREVRESHHPVHYETVFSTQHGAVYLDITLAPVLAADGECTHILRTARDITERKLIQEELRESNERFANAFESAPNGMALTALDGHWLRINKAMVEMVGYSEQELLGMNYRQLTHPDDVEENVDLNRRLLAGEFKSFQMQKRYYHKSGELIWALLSVSIVRDEQGHALYSISQMINISELKQAEETLRLQSAALEQIGNAVVIMGRDMRIQWVNPAWTTLTGYSFAESIGQFPALVRSGVHTPAFYQDIEDSMLRGEAWQGEIVNKRKDGSLYTEYMLRTPVLDDKGELSHFVVIKNDITERKLAEDALRNTNILLEQTLGQSPVPMALVSMPDGILRHVNSACKRFLGVEDEPEMIGQLFSAVQPSWQDLDIFGKPTLLKDLPLSLSLFGQNTKGEERKIIRKDGSVVYGLVSSAPIYDAAGKLIAGYMVMVDITDLKLAAESLRRSEEAHRAIIQTAMDGFWMVDLQGRILDVNDASCQMSGYSRRELLQMRISDLEATELREDISTRIQRIISQGGDRFEASHRRKDGSVFDVEISVKYQAREGGRLLAFIRDVSERKRSEQIIEKRMLALTQPVEGGAISFEELFNLAEIQDIQDKFSQATGVASIITQVDGTPITAPSNFTILCSEIIRKTGAGCANCMKSDAAIGRYHPAGAIVQPCLSGGLWDAGASITVGGQHIANWLIGQVRDQTQTEENMRLYARQIGVDEQVFLDAFYKVPSMSHAHFEEIAAALFTLASQISTAAYQNLLQARFITERKLAEDALRRSEASLRDAQRIAQTGSWEWDMSANKVAWSEEMYRVFDIDPEAYDGSPEALLKVLHPDDVEAYLTSVKSNLARGDSTALEFRVIHRDGSVHTLSGDGQMVFDQDGKPIRSIGTVQDITERKRVEQELRQAHAELEQRVQERTAELRVANQALEKAARMKDEFLASMSHELRTPLTGILGLSEALQMVTYGELNEKQRRALKNIELSGRHLLTLINDILDLSKIEAGKFDLQIEACSLGEICQASLQLTKGLANQKHQKVSFQMDPASIILKADARRLKQMVVNLMGNAIKFTAEGGNLGIEVRADASRQEVYLCVWDEGIGIAKEDFPRLFKPFVQLDSSLSRQHSGTGLGLSLVERLAGLHDGRVEVESEPGQGSRFTVILPWREVDPDPLRNRKLVTGPLVYRRGSMEAGPQVLIADDNELVLEMVSDFLSSRNFRVECARGGQEFLDKLERMQVDIILMDIQMPGMDGIEVIRRIRAHPQKRIAALPVIAVTALAMTGDRERCLKAGADAYLSKPVQLNELAKMIDELLH